MTIGKDFNVVTVSIDPTERPVLAEAKQAHVHRDVRATRRGGWLAFPHRRSARNQELWLRPSASAMRMTPNSKQFAHASVIMMLTPEGKLSRYFYGIQYPERDVRLGLEEASQGKISSPVDAILLFCYHYDPHTGKYGLLISRVIQLAGGLTILIGGIFLFFLFRGEHYELPKV